MCSSISVVSSRTGAMASVLSSFFSRDPKANFGYEIPLDVITVQNGISIGKSFKKVPDSSFYDHLSYETLFIR